MSPATTNTHREETEVESSAAIDIKDDFYSSGNESDSDEANVAVYDQVTGYLSSKSESVDGLLAYPIVAEAFKKSNSTLPSSTTVERLFSAAAQILTVRRSTLSDDNFDKLVFVRSQLKLLN